MPVSAGHIIPDLHSYYNPIRPIQTLMTLMRQIKYGRCGSLPFKEKTLNKLTCGFTGFARRMREAF